MTDYNAFADQLNIETPEQVDLRFPIAGIGSRFLALLTDTALQVGTQILLTIILVLVVPHFDRIAAPLSGNAEKWFIAALVMFYFLLFWGYFALFEAFWNGQTPGKRLLKIRVIKDAGRQITLFEALARNLLRIIDALPGVYLVGVIAMLSNREGKRLGDLVAGTLVVHDRTSSQPLLTSSSRTFTASSFPQPAVDFHRPHFGGTITTLPADAVARLTHQDLQVIDAFFGRILDLDLTTRDQVAARLAARMCQKMALPAPEGLSPERLLEAIAHQMRSHSR